MRHRKDGKKLGRTSSHRESLLASLVCALIEERRIETTRAKAMLARRLAERMVALARRGTLDARRQALACLRREHAVRKLFLDIAPAFKDRSGGFTRVIKTGPRRSDGAEMALLEWVGLEVPNKKRKTRKKGEGEGEEKKSEG